MTNRLLVYTPKQRTLQTLAEARGFMLFSRGVFWNAHPHSIPPGNSVGVIDPIEFQFLLLSLQEGGDSKNRPGGDAMAAFISDRPIRIGIVDGNDRFRCILHTSLDLLPNCKVVAEAKNGEEAIAMVEYVHPDVVLMDIDLPAMDGIETTRIINSRFSDTKVIILTLHSDQTASDSAIHAGACRFLNKYCGQERLYQSIKECSPGPLRVVGNSPH